jgi:integrase
LNKYKTRKTYGKYIIDPIPEKLSKAIIALIKEQDYVDGENLFMSIKAKAYGGGFSGRLKKVFKEATISPENIKGRDITLNTLRHSFISYFIKDNISNKKKNEYATAMGHSISMQDLYRRIIEEEKD